MKLRIRGNSLRLRLLRGEVEQFGKTGRVTETIRFGASPAAELSYVLEISRQTQQIRANFADNKITVIVPEETARNWIESEQVALMSEQLFESDAATDSTDKTFQENNLKILIEKDFVCLDRQNDPDNADAFPHPTGKCS